MKKTLRLILGDQLNHNHSWYQQVDDEVVYVMMEIRTETDYVKHHIQKVVAFFQAMRLFANELNQNDHQVIYLQLDSADNKQSFTENIRWICEKYKIENIEYQLPDEYRVDQELKLLSDELKLPVQEVDSEHFYTSRTEFAEFFAGKKQFLMESFYRYMRKKHQVLMSAGQPEGDKWNFDSDNRKKIPVNHTIIHPYLFHREVSEIVQMIQKHGVETIGVIQEKQFFWPVTRNESLELLSFFIENCLTYFGTFQDAMTTDSWSVYHSRISFAMNVKLLSPKEVVDAVIQAYRSNEHSISLNQVEGFVRQIIGWREYMRGVYWMHMPEYAELNFFNHENKLPDWYWTGETNMKCLSHSIKQSLQFAYAHHIQRLMVTGNFALLAGIHPDEVDRWYLGIYIDALDWVEITNTRGMSQFADGGIVGTKPYVSSANYIDKMSSYCGKCYYNSKQKVGDKACPFNSLYWHFYARNESLLRKNPRIGMMYVTWDKMQPEVKTELLNQAEYYLKNINDL
jgi:deoxyribodipyrimidine photolyase-related protein